MSWQWSGKQILSLFTWVALLLYVLGMVKKADFVGIYVGRAPFVCPGNDQESKFCRYLRGSRSFCMSRADFVAISHSIALFACSGHCQQSRFCRYFSYYRSVCMF